MAHSKQTGADSAAAMHIEGFVLDVDYIVSGSTASIRLAVKCSDGRVEQLYDSAFKPYFYVVPRANVDAAQIAAVITRNGDEVIKVSKVEQTEKLIAGKTQKVLRVFAALPAHVPKLSEALRQFGTCYEYDIPFAKRYSVDRQLIPFRYYSMQVAEHNGNKQLLAFEDTNKLVELDALTVLCFDIEVYNPREQTLAAKDPVIMISYYCNSKGSIRQGVLTYKQIDLPFIEVLENEKAMIKRFIQIVGQFNVDVVTGYNSANYDIKYLIDRSKTLGIEFNLSRFEGQTRIERHGLVDRVKIGGAAHVDMYLVSRFIATVGAAERILKLNRYTLKDVYEAIQNKKKLTVEKKSIHAMWDGAKQDLESLATYNLNDAEALCKVFETFMPIMIELCRVTGDVVSDTCVSTTGQLVEFLLMRYATHFGELIPNKPEEEQIKLRNDNPIEGAYVKTPDPGIYDNLAVFDFRGLYPSIIIAHNIDPATLCTDCDDYYESPNGDRFGKARKGIMPMILTLLIEQRSEVKKQFKKNPDDIYLGSRSMALKILSNSFFGYLGYARSRWYSRECCGSVTAYGRKYIKETIATAEQGGFRVIYGDTDSIVMLLGDKAKDDALNFMSKINAALPGSMELELEAFYTRGVFVGKKSDKDTEARGAKKKYALITEAGKIKIRGFELVRRDWSRIARDTQMKVLEAVLKEGSAEKAAAIVKETVLRLKNNQVPLSELVISTQIRKPIASYDINSPEISAAKKAIKSGAKTKDEMEHSVIGYIITKHGSSISEKAELESLAKDYDADYYINHQLMPAVMRILKELNYSVDELRLGGNQKRL